MGHVGVGQQMDVGGLEVSFKFSEYSSSYFDRNKLNKSLHNLLHVL